MNFLAWVSRSSWRFRLEHYPSQTLLDLEFLIKFSNKIYERKSLKNLFFGCNAFAREKHDLLVLHILNKKRADFPLNLSNYLWNILAFRHSPQTQFVSSRWRVHDRLALHVYTQEGSVVILSLETFQNIVLKIEDSSPAYSLGYI